MPRPPGAIVCEVCKRSTNPPHHVKHKPDCPRRGTMGGRRPGSGRKKKVAKVVDA